MITALAAVIALSACAPRTEIRRTEQIQDILPPVFELVPGQTSIERFDPPGAGGRLELTVGAQVLNPNEFGVWLDGIDYTVYLEGRAVGRGALAPDVYLEAARRLGVAADRCAAVEDSANGIRSAHAAGMRVLGSITPA